MSCKYALLDTAWGMVGLAWTEKGIAVVVLPGMPVKYIRESILDYHPLAVESDIGGEEAAAAAGKILDYFQGKKVEMEAPLDLSFATPFQREVFGALVKVPWGKTVSYSQLAAAIGKPRAGRAVGAANARNRVPLFVPCHRVVAADGSLGGFSGPGGVKLKKRLLDLEAG